MTCSDINFWLTTPVDLTNGLDRPMGGAEVSAVQLARALNASKHVDNVSIFCNTTRTYNDSDFGDGVNVFPYSALYEAKGIDTLIVVRAHPILNTRIRNWFRKPPRLLLNWSGDAYDQSNNHIFWDRKVAQEFIDAFICKSQWQRDTLNEVYPALRGKTHTIYNGVDDALFTEVAETDPNKFIWASTWYRGLRHMVVIWPRLREWNPDAHLHVYARTSLYLDDNSDHQARKLFDTLNNLDGVTLHDPVPQRDLIYELATSKLLLYPNDDFLESSCGVAQQSICAGTPVITSHRAGLPETVQTEGVCVAAKPGSADYYNEFTKRTIELCENNDRYAKMQRKGWLRQTDESWNRVALRWTNYLESL